MRSVRIPAHGRPVRVADFLRGEGIDPDTARPELILELTRLEGFYRLAARDTFAPLDHPPGHRCEADFGHIHVDFPTGRPLVPVLVMTWSYSNAPFALALPTERTEAVLHGMTEAFAFFGCVPAEVWWDNPATVALHVGRGRERTVYPRYVAMASHFTFAPQFCLPATPQENLVSRTG